VSPAGMGLNAGIVLIVVSSFCECRATAKRVISKRFHFKHKKELFEFKLDLHGQFFDSDIYNNHKI
jgi:hypothetical protein